MQDGRLISRLAGGRRSLTRQAVLWMPHTVIVSAGLRQARYRPVLLLVPGQVL